MEQAFEMFFGILHLEVNIFYFFSKRRIWIYIFVKEVGKL